MTNELIADVLGDDHAAAEDAWQALAAAGASAAPAILEVIRAQGEGAPRSPLHDVLLSMDDPELVPTFCEVLDSPVIDLRITAFQYLGLAGDGRALDPLITNLNDDVQVSKQYLAAKALGDLGERRAIEPLLGIAAEHLGELAEPDAAVDRVLEEVEEEWLIDPLMLLPHVATALAQLGRHDLAPVMVRLAAFDPSDSELDDLDDIRIARGHAVASLCHTTAPGMVAALQKAAREGNPEIRESALEALFYLGLPDAVETLLTYLDDSSRGVAFNSQVWMNRIVGEAFEPGETDPERPRSWWRENGGRFTSGVCHRRGMPVAIAGLIDEIEEQPNAVPDVVRELRIITGKDLRRDRRGARRAADWVTLARDWLSGQREGRFEVGKLYKYGHERDVAEL